MSDSSSNPKPSPKVTVKQKPVPALVDEAQVISTQDPNTVGSTDPMDESDSTPTPPLKAPAPVVQTPPATPTPVVVALSHDAQTVASMLAEYKQLLSPVIVTPSAINRSIKIMSRICDVLCTSPHNDARDVMWKFHQDHRDTLMREDMGLRGLRDVQRKQAMRIATVYTLYRHKVLQTGLIQGDEQSRVHTSQALLMYMSNKR